MKKNLVFVGIATVLSCTCVAETLYNGIVLPAVWPPARDPSREKPMAVPYLEEANRPKVIPIDLGRQLFVDDFLIEKTDLAHVYPHPVKYEGNPVLKPETPEEINAPYGAGASPIDGGLWWDPKLKKFRLWYGVGWARCIGYAESEDGIHFTRVPTDAATGKNLVLPEQYAGSWTVVRDEDTKDPKRRWRLYIAHDYDRKTGKRSHWGVTYVSADGFTWRGPYRMGFTDDRSTMHYNPFRHVWCFNLRINTKKTAPAWPEAIGRCCCYVESEDFAKGLVWNWGTRVTGRAKTAVIWQQADALDPIDPDYPDTPQLYNIAAVGYESIMLSLHQIHHGPKNGDCAKKNLPKITDLVFAYSRDGFHYSRPDRTAAIASERWTNCGKKWDIGYVNPLGNLCVIKDEKMYFYYGANEGNAEKSAQLKAKYSAEELAALKKADRGKGLSGMYDKRATGLAILRRDGFAGLKTETTGSVTTRPVSFSGKKLFVNLEAPEGSVKAEVLDAEKDEVLAEVGTGKGDSTKLALGDVAAFAGRPVRLRFTVEKGTLFAFWVSPDESGKSGGYLAGGGPGYPGLRDL